MRYSCQFCHFSSDEIAKLWESSDCPFEQFSNRLIIDRFFLLIVNKLLESLNIFSESSSSPVASWTHKGCALDQDSSFDFVKTNDMI